MINPFLVPIFNDITVKGVESSIEAIYKSADEGERKVIEDTIESLIKLVN